MSGTARIIALTFVLCLSAWGLVNGYHVDPVKAAWSGKVPGDPEFGGVSQLVTCNFDSVVYCELFVGSYSDTGSYKVDVYETGNGPRIAYNDGVVPAGEHKWYRFDLSMVAGQSFTKGKQYEFKFTRSGSDSIEFYYDETKGGPYAYGRMLLPGDQPPPSPDADLCMRVYGVMDTITRFDFGAFCVLPGWDARDTTGSRLRRDTWVDRAVEVGLGWGVIDAQWHVIQPRPDTVCDFYDFDEHVWRLTRSPAGPLHARPVALLTCVPKWASSRVDSTRNPQPSAPDSWRYDSCIHCAPRNLWAEVGSNYWSAYLDSLLGHRDREPTRDTLSYPCDIIHTWIAENEPNDTCWDVWNHPGVTGWWRRPNRDYLTGFDGLRGLCSLYVRMAYLAAESIRGREGHDTDRILIGNTHRAVGRNTEFLVGGVDWLRICYEIALKEPGYVFWDGVAFHPYQEEHLGFKPEQFENDLDSIRAVMREFRDEGGEVWNTEMGWNEIPRGLTQEQDCRNVAEVLTAGLGSQTRPEGGYDNNCWWAFYRPTAWGCWGLVETSLARQKPFYAFKQTHEQLTGKRCNGRVMLGDDRDDSCRIYEFENPADSGRKTWVAWANDAAGTGRARVDARIPARSDGLESALLAYSPAPTVAAKSASASGWLPVRLDARPVFITESTAIARPDLVADSVRFDAPLSAGEPATLRAWVRNAGRQTPDAPLACAFYGNGESLGVATRTEPIGSSSAVVFTLSLARVPERLRGTALISATVNPRRSFVEAFGLDDNTAYMQTVVR